MSEALAQRRVTRQRAAIQEALFNAEGFRSAQQLHEELRAAGHRVGLTTVYRELQNLSAAGEIDSLVGPDGEAIYRRCTSREHHHHLLCRSCGLAVEVASDEIESWAARMSSSHGFKEVSHTLELYGLCARCHGDNPQVGRTGG